jgi:hypothetical protein
VAASSLSGAVVGQMEWLSSVLHASRSLPKKDLRTSEVDTSRVVGFRPTPLYQKHAILSLSMSMER